VPWDKNLHKVVLPPTREIPFFCVSGASRRRSLYVLSAPRTKRPVPGETGASSLPHSISFTHTKLFFFLEIAALSSVYPFFPKRYEGRLLNRLLFPRPVQPPLKTHSPSLSRCSAQTLFFFIQGFPWCPLVPKLIVPRPVGCFPIPPPPDHPLPPRPTFLSYPFQAAVCTLSSPIKEPLQDPPPHCARRLPWPPGVKTPPSAFSLFRVFHSRRPLTLQHFPRHYKRNRLI